MPVEKIAPEKIKKKNNLFDIIVNNNVFYIKDFYKKILARGQKSLENAGLYDDGSFYKKKYKKC